MRNKPDAFRQAESLTSTILEKINGINKSRKKFITDILLLFMGMRGRYNFLNLARYGNYLNRVIVIILNNLLIF